ncbi:MAG TPA: preprotein translocase subunit YajC [Thermoanaerobaculia bacterium]|nr:preprotein translocase subunit YajC [Thermoanaerobaculia bacterium]
MITIALLQAKDSGGTAGLLLNLLPIAAIFLVFYFLVIAPASKQRRKTQDMLGGLKKGDRVVTSGGIYGTIQGVEADVVYLKIAENVKVRVARSAITGILSGEAGTE